MKSLFLATAAVAALAAAPALAQEPVGSIGAGYIHNDTEGFKSDGAVIDGVVAMPAFGDWTVTLNGAVTYSDSDLGDDTSASGAAHLTRMFGNDLRAGGFVGLSDIGGENYISVGGEVQRYFASATVSGVAAYTDLDGADAWTLGADAGFYVSPSLRLNVGGSYNTLDTNAGDIDAWSYGAGAEYQMANSPFGVFASYERLSLEDVDVDSDTVMVGLRYNFGGLQARDRAGANLGRTLGGVRALGGAF